MGDLEGGSEEATSRGIQNMLKTFGLFRQKRRVKHRDTDRREAQTAAAQIPTNVIISCEAGKVLQPVRGKIIPQEEIPDDLFANAILGKGVGIEPEEEIIVAPYDGEISFIADSRHSIGITGSGNMKLLIHVGVGTVAMNGDGFTPLVARGDRVQAGQRILKFDRNKIKTAGYSDLVVIVLTNSDDYNDAKVFL